MTAGPTAQLSMPCRVSGTEETAIAFPVGPHQNGPNSGHHQPSLVCLSLKKCLPDASLTGLRPLTWPA